ncbi:hypothetical protein [Antribacter gilvus]|uniref:hypothetical protein n=1 Tax=Antribacter gilvus TaxID=2304675 RepID=UPI000F769E48|nr:hypothetical protein [Antribacter gilvus]
MGILTEYFAAPTDEAAATVLSAPGGPSAPDRTAGGPRFDTVELPSVDPFVMLGTLAEMLCGLPYGEITANPRHGALVGSGGDEGPWVVTVSEVLTADLAASQPNRLAEMVRAWTRTHAVNAPPHRLVAGMVALSALASRAVVNRESLYCWTCLSD